MKALKMNELTNKFIIMSRIAVSLHFKNLTASVSLSNDYCAIFVHSAGSQGTIETLFSSEVSEQELLNWWSIIEGDTSSNQ